MIEGWERGFSTAPRLVLGALAGGYRGLLETREWLYGRGVLRSRAMPCPVVAIGNLTVGGTGKTPAVELAVQTLAALGRQPAVVSRGYRRKTSGVQIVADTASIRLDPEDAGDEPFLLARRLPGVPVVVGSNRFEAARLAVERFGVTAIVLDDGFQHRTLRKDLEIVMTRRKNPWGNGRLLPHGPLREPLGALARADLLVVAGAADAADLAEIKETARRYTPSVPVLGARYAPVECWKASGMRPMPLTELAGMRLLAFAGIASPDAFEQTLSALSITTNVFIPFPDHHWYAMEELEALERRAVALGAAGLITTEKDWIRLRHVAHLQRPLYVLSIRLELTTGQAEWQRAFADVCAKR